MVTVLAILALAGLFALAGVLPFPDRGCDGCSGECTSCPLDREAS